MPDFEFVLLGGMHAAPALRLALAGLFALLATVAGADESCRIAFDMGSSGIRAGASGSATTTQSDIDFLGPLWAGRGLEETVAPTIAALRELPEKAGFPSACPRVGGGFSAWRLAAQQDPGALAATLARIQAASGTAVLVIPQVQEGAYGYFGAQRLLGERLTTSHVLDIGGGSLQVAGARTSYGEALGQKIWHRLLCQEIRNAESVPCDLQPLTGDELAIARTLVAEKLGGVAAALPGPVTMTAISRPVSRGVLPAVARLVPAGTTPGSMQRSAVSSAIDLLAGATLPETMQLLGSNSRHVAFLLSDLLLVEGLLQATDGETLQVTELDLTNLPGLLADDRAYDWGRRYGCYLERLRSLGSAAYASDPASCP
ncbi:MAG TPA: hypothetical protein VN639_09980 [Azonexus sp.]|nr:hypothetical protein [Azonexus sp.]